MADILSEMPESKKRNTYTIINELYNLDILGVKNYDGEIIYDVDSIDPEDKKQYYIKDNLLMFYFEIMNPLINTIKKNTSKIYTIHLILQKNIL